MPFFLLVVVAVYGSVYGSVLTALIPRIKSGCVLFNDRSKCKCGAIIPWYRNIPIVTGLFFRLSKCCSSKIPLKYPIIELVSCLLCLGVASIGLLLFPGSAVLAITLGAVLGGILSTVIAIKLY